MPIALIASIVFSLFPARGPTHEDVSDRDRAGLHGPVRVCVEERIGPEVDGKPWNFSVTTEYDPDGRLLVQRYKYHDGSLTETTYSRDSHGRLLRTVGTSAAGSSETTYTYDDAGRVLKIAWTYPNAAPTETRYTYDSSGRLVSEASTADFATQSEYRYDERGRKTKIMHVPPPRPNTAVGTGDSLLEAAERGAFAPADGGTITILYDEDDRATEAQVRNSQGEFFTRIVRTYDSGHAVEEKQVMENPQLMIPADMRAQILANSGATAAEFNAQLKSVLEGAAGTGLTNKYDSQGHLIESRMRILGNEQIKTFNEHGDQVSETSISTRNQNPHEPGDKPMTPDRNETRMEYRYDSHGNWIEKTTKWIANGGVKEPGDTTRRTITYYSP